MRTLKTHHIVFLVCAAAAPLTVVSAGVTAAYAASGLAGVPLGYLICGGLVVMFALGFCAMAKEIPNTAAFFSYVSAGLGKSHGLAASWLAIISYSMMQTALVCLLGFMAEDLLLRVTGRSVTWVLFSIVAVILVGTLGVRSADLASRIIGFLLILELLTVLFFCIVVLINRGHDLAVGTFSPMSLIGGGTGTLLAFTIAGFMGIESSSMYAEEAEDPGKTIPRATLISIAVISVFYGFSSWAIAQSVGEENVVTDAQEQGSTLLFTYLGSHGFTALVPFLQALLVTSLFAAVVSFHNSISRYLMALGREHVLWKSLGRVTADGVPRTASVSQSCLAIVVVIAMWLTQKTLNMDDSFPSDIVFSWASNAGGFGLIFLFLVTSISVLRYFTRRERKYSSFITTYSPVVAIVGFGAMFVLVLLNFKNLIGDAELWYLVFVIPGVILSCGIAGFARGEYLRKKRPAIYQNIGSGHSPELLCGESLGK